ncbi:MAG: hypothetical protein GY739_10445 [Mesoflavibacter sp.]|nr:hypothetical protein [Mesoflavibacter sp.]
MSNPLTEELIRKELTEANIIHSLVEYPVDQSPGDWDVFIAIKDSGISISPGIEEETLGKLIDCMAKD